uniref:Uncharacterized protein n=1 Tax=Anguilla anguilla TaxID=7936 RepID=A0A0E9R3B5_ANGAN
MQLCTLQHNQHTVSETFILHGMHSYFYIMWLKTVNNPSKHEKHLIKEN